MSVTFVFYLIQINLCILQICPRFRCIRELPDCCVIDPFDNIFPVVDRLRIQEILLGLVELKTESQCNIRGPYFLKVFYIINILYIIFLCNVCMINCFNSLNIYMFSG